MKKTWVINVYAPNIGTLKYTKQFLTDLKGDIVSNTIIIGGDFTTPLASMDRSSIQKVNKETMALNETLGQMYLTDLLRIFHPNAAEHTLFSRSNGTFSRIETQIKPW